MGTKTVGFAISDEDQAQLDELVEYFGQGNRSAYLRATFKVMKSVKLAEQWREMQAFGQQRLAEEGLSVEDIPDITRRILKDQP